MGAQYLDLSELPADMLARSLVHRIYKQHVEPAAMNPDGTLKLASLPSEDVRRIAHELIEKALKSSTFKDKTNGGESTPG